MTNLRSQYLSIRDEIDVALSRVLFESQFIMGPDVQKLESDIAKYCDCDFAVSVASGSDAIYLCLLALGIGRGDEIITTPFTFMATASNIVRVGALPVFVDIDPLTYNIDPHQIEKKITSRTKAIIPVHLYGQPCEMSIINDIAEKYRLYVIEDAAQAIGARYKGKRIGGLGDLGIISFFPTKNLGAYGDGGIVLTNDRDFAKKVDVLRRHGSTKKYYYDTIGVNSRLDTIQASILNVKLRYLEKWIESRRLISERYDLLLDKNYVLPPFVQPDNFHVYHQYTINISKNRENLVSHLKTKGIETTVYYPLCLHLQAAFSWLNHQFGDFPNAERASQAVLSLPCYPELSFENIDQICNEINSFFGKIK